MTVQLKDVLNGLSLDEQQAVEERTRELIAEEMSLRDLRKAYHLTQKQMAKSLGIGQEGVSRLEKRTDLLISTLQGYVKAMGEQLRIIADFPNRPPVILSGIADMDEGTSTAGSKSKPPRK
jgi:DNA-binding transcriptional regulator YiaG